MSGARDRRAPADPVVVVGAGHNGLICAAYLARAGVPTVLLEARDQVGGCASTIDALGARVNICNCDHLFVRATPVVDELDLATHGLRYLDLDPAYLNLRWSGGTPWLLFHDAERTVAGLARTHPTQVERYRRYLRTALPLARLMLEVTAGPPTPGRIVPAVARRGGRSVATLLRWSRRSAVDVLRSFFSDDDLVAPALTTGPVVWGVDPTRPGTGMAALGYAMKHLVPVGRPIGGSGALTEAVRASFEAAGGTVRCGARVDRILTEQGRVRAVRLLDGEVLAASTVITACDPGPVLVDWLDDRRRPVERLRRRYAEAPAHDGYESKLDAVIGELPRPRVLEDAAVNDRVLGDVDPAAPTWLVSPSIEAMSAAHRRLAHGEVADDPMLIVNTPSVPDPSLRTPHDHHLLSLEVLWTPYALAGGWTDSPEPRRWLGRFAELVQPGWLDHVVDWRAMTPVDYERELSMTRGYAPSFSGSPVAALVGRRPELTRYRTPVDGLHLCGAATFPGAGVWGASGRNVAAAVLAARR